MATNSANLAQRATPKQNINSNDPFSGTPSPYQSSQLRYATLDNDQFTSYSANSPAQARRALEAHLKETDRRIHDAARLGNTLLEQKKNLSARLADIENVKTDDDMPTALRQKLADLEKEYNEVGRESARAFLPKLRATKSEATTLTAQGGSSPTKVLAPASRRQRNQPNARVHDIEFATEISTSLLAQVRQLQAALVEKDETLKDTASARAQLETDVTALAQRVKQMDEHAQSFKDENWNLETKLQELEGALKTSTDQGNRLGQTLKSTQTDKAAAQRDLDELKLAHDKAVEAHSDAKRQQDSDLHTLRRDIAIHQADKDLLQKKIDELHSNNKELARAVSYRFNQPADSTTLQDELDQSDEERDESVMEGIDMSPVKGTPARPGMLESETLKSSLNHAHRMIQNLKNNIHREKSEKMDLKRMLNEARDELEKRRTDGAGARAVNDKSKKRTADRDVRARRPARLGANGAITTEVLEDEPEWEDHDVGDQATPSKSRNFSAAMPGAFVSANTTDVESTDAFETADERRETATETEGFHTGAESFAEDSDDLTETEGDFNRLTTGRGTSSAYTGSATDRRRSFLSTASASTDEDESYHARTPNQSAVPKYKLRMSKTSRRSLRHSQILADSPASNNSTPQTYGKTLGDELDALDDSSIEGTPSKTRDDLFESADVSPESHRSASAAITPARSIVASNSPFIAAPSLQHHVESSPEHEGDQTVLVHDTDEAKPAMLHDGIISQLWQPDTRQESAAVAPVYTHEGGMDETEDKVDTTARETENTPHKGLGERLAGVAGGALAGFGIGRVSKERTPEPETRPEVRPSAFDDSKEVVPTATIPPAAYVPALTFSSIIVQDFEPVALPVVNHSTIPATPLVPKRSSKRLNSMSDSSPEPVPALPSQPERDVLQPQTPRRVPSLPQSLLLSTPHSAGQSSVFDPEEATREYVEPNVYGGGRGANGIPTLTFGEDEVNIITTTPRHPVHEISPNTITHEPLASERDLLPVIKPLQMQRPMLDEGSQTVVSGREIDEMMRNKNSAAAEIGAGAVGATVGAVAVAELNASHNAQRSESANSTRSRASVPTPPLPSDHNKKIAAAAKTPAPTSVPGSMGPPLVPASAYKNKVPTTPTAGSMRGTSRDGTTPRPGRQSIRGSPVVGKLSRSTSVSSFASELDERFDIHRNNLMYPDDLAPATDPRMIQAITQTMIGEYLWKYTRKAGRVENSTSRHRRFFWVHPYTRTLYWSEQDPSTTTKGMMKAKSVPIESVRAVIDDNVNPPGLHRKSLVIVTRSREIVVTAPTGQRHDTWYNALSYLLLRSTAEKEAEDAFNNEDLEEFNPGGFSFRRSISRMTRGRSRSRASLSSYNSRTTRNESPTKGEGAMLQQPTLANQRSQSSRPAATSSASNRVGRRRDSASRFSTMASRLVPTNGSQSRAGSSLSHRGGGGSDIYNASVVGESAEDVRQIIEKQDRDAAMLENVRACCDGKHDVGSLSRHGKHTSMRRGAGDSNHHHHHHHNTTQSSAAIAEVPT